MARKAVSKKLRFEVFKRDSFTCQYCGKAAPDVVLHCDHVIPVAKGGKTDILNLVTSCQDCNSGKGAVELSDNTVIQKRKKQLDALQERREQLEMLFEWQNSLLEFENEIVAQLTAFWKSLTEIYTLTRAGEQALQKWLKRYSVDEIMTSMNLSVSQYLEHEFHQDTGKQIPTAASVQKAFDYIPRICANRKRMGDNPHLGELYYIRGILRNRFRVNEHVIMNTITRYHELGATTETLKSYAKTSVDWEAFQIAIEVLISQEVPF